MYFAKEVLSSSSELRKKWEDEVRKSVSKVKDQKERWSTVSDLEINRLYGPEDIKDMDFVRDICDRIALMRGGKIVQIGKTAEVLAALTEEERKLMSQPA